MRRTFMLGALAALIGAAGARAEVKLHTLCSEGMVLQQKAKVNIWGTADKGEKVSVQFRSKSAETAADGQGNWLVTIESGDAGGPFDMAVAGSNKIDLKNVLVGEVWVCSGQSNMEWSVNACNQSDKQVAFGSSHNSNLRMFTVKKTPLLSPVKDVTGSWLEADPKTVGGFSAVGYFFGRDLQNDLKVPIGLIHTSWGGTRAEAWTNRETLQTKGSLYEGDLKAATPKSSTDPSANVASNPNVATSLYNGMIYPILNYSIKGAIWYQGESNAGKAFYYRELFPMMIQNWRKDWKQGDFPFYFVQLAPFTSIAKEPGESNWAELREAQAMTLKLPNTGMAVITDMGHEFDIHPTPKRPVGERLALIARAQTYGEKIEYSGPTYKSMKVEGKKVTLTFDHADGLTALELVPTDTRKNKQGQEGSAWRVDPKVKNAKLVGFTVAGEDKKFHTAQAEINGDAVTVWSEQVSNPVAVRYGWTNHPICNLFNKEGLPASPFRTDTFPVSTQPKQ